MNALLDPMPQLPGDWQLSSEHDADSDPRTYTALWEDEQAAQRALSRREDVIDELHARIAELERRLAGTPPMPPEPSDITW